MNTPVTERTPHLQPSPPARCGHHHLHRDVGQLAAEKGAVNLGQGFPDFDCDPALVAP
jgi:methionine aminotransferase